LSIRTVIVDDEGPARDLLRELLAAYMDIEVVQECANGFEAVKAITELKPDLVFLDVQMPKLNGFEVLELLGAHPAVIFVTAYDTYALKAFDVHAVDYLLKPFGSERLAEALGRVRERLRTSGVRSLAPVIAEARQAELPLQRLLIRDGSEVHVIPAEKIDYVKAEDDYVAVVAGGKTYMKQEPLSDLAARLDPTRFIRVHRSFVLQIDRLARIELYAKDSRVAFLKDGTKIPVSRTGYERLKELL